MIVFPMAGLSSRFASAGYETPKYQLRLWDGYVFDYAVSSFSESFGDETFLFIYRETGGVRSFIEARTRKLGIDDVRFHKVDRPTAGQAETVEQGILGGSFTEDSSLTIFNIDTFKKPRFSSQGLRSGISGWLEVFRGHGANWSFVRPDRNTPGLVSETTEKVPISDLCSNGLYHFSSIELFREALMVERGCAGTSELYIAPIYNHLIASGHRIGFRVVDQQDLVFCGLPTEYESLLEVSPPW